MGRPINADREATRRRILERAIELFSRDGVGSTSIRDVARDAGVSLAMVHYYFVSKEQLYDACVAAMYVELAALRSDLEKAMARRGSVAAHLERAVIASFRFAREHQVAVRLLVRTTIETGGNSPRGREMLASFLDGATALIGKMTRRAPATLRFPLQSLVFLVARYAIYSGEDLAIAARVTGRARTRDGEALRAVEAHLARTTVALLLPSARRA